MEENHLTVTAVIDGKHYTTSAVALESFHEQYYWVKPDYELPQNHEHYPIRKAAIKLGGAPTVFRAGEYSQHTSYRTVPMTEPWQRFKADLLAFAEYGKRLSELSGDAYNHIVQAFTGTYGTHVAFTNKVGFGDEDPVRVNYISGENVNNKDAEPPKFSPLLTATNSVGGSDDGIMVKINTFNFDDGPPTYYDISILNDSRVLWATVIKNISLDDNTYAINRFPRLARAQGVPYALVSRDSLYYPLGHMTKYSGQKRGLYNPLVERITY